MSTDPTSMSCLGLSLWPLKRTLYLPSKCSTKAYKQKMPRNIPGIGMDCSGSIKRFYTKLWGWQCINRVNESERIGAIREPCWRLACFESRILLHPLFSLLCSVMGIFIFCIFVAQGFVPTFDLKCMWSKIFLALIWKFTTFSIWMWGFYEIEPFQSVVITPAMLKFSVRKCLHITRSQNNRIT